MDPMLPAAYGGPVSLADVLPSCLAAIEHEPNALALSGIDRAIVVLVDGLGASALRARAGHARFLSPRLGRASTMTSGFPTTTAAGIASLTTGARPGAHGLVGYRVRDIARDRIVNQLSGWDADMVPEVWQRRETVFETARGRGVPTFAIGQTRYRDSGFTRAVLRGAEYVGADRMGARFTQARRVLALGGRSLTYLYVQELDVAGHASGCESDAWLTALETLDAELAALEAGLRPGEAVIVTADHGVLDVPAHAHVLFDAVPELIDGVRHVGGEPRCLQLYLEPSATASDAAGLTAAWREHEGDNAWIATRDEAIAAGWFGESVDAEVRPRIGDVLVAARRRVAYYDSRADATSRRMVGQHGSLTPEETRVPLIRLGAAAR
ncbi:alkaline phosphatase family protein [Microbacterium sp. STN6]|uniref:alkaline phosphatase family protein n=1 Tax=Microbacterium sp. STN6 TaxID=2995588 RepID=UPI002260E24B|nr:nucleotide pyrophosphatase/phosphodiesterase family protein [Microbacterium sp. STN6]MCX7522438.1 alkaline phosphatase family protein [Microbacterium sp. STN6]